MSDRATRFVDTILRANTFGCGFVVFAAVMWEGSGMSMFSRIFFALVSIGCMAYACVPRQEGEAR